MLAPGSEHIEAKSRGHGRRAAAEAPPWAPAPAPPAGAGEGGRASSRHSRRSSRSSKRSLRFRSLCRCRCCCPRRPGSSWVVPPRRASHPSSSCSIACPPKTKSEVPSAAPQWKALAGGGGCAADGELFSAGKRTQPPPSSPAGAAEEEEAELLIRIQVSDSANRPSPRPPCTTTRSSPQIARVLPLAPLVVEVEVEVGVEAGVAVDFSPASQPHLSPSSNATATAPMRAGGEPHRAARQERCMLLNSTLSERDKKKKKLQKRGGRMPLFH